MKVAIYISNHGYGHATRMQALAQELTRYGIFCHIRTNRPEFLFETLDDQFYQYGDVTLDEGMIHENWWTIDYPATREKLIRRYNDSEEIVASEVEFLTNENIDLVIGDIPPLAFEIAHRAKVFSIAISNFDWHYIYRKVFRNDPEIAAVLDRIEDMQRKADIAFRLPFSDDESLIGFRRVVEKGILARSLPKLREKFCREHDIDPDDLIVRIAFGGEGGNPIDMDRLLHVPAVTVLTNDQHGEDHDNYRALSGEQAFTEALGATDVIITKLGYSTLAELTQMGIFLIYSFREDYPENIVLKHGLDGYSRKIRVPLDRIGNADWRSLLEEAKSRLNEPYNATMFRNCNCDIALSCIRHRFENQAGKTALIDVGTNNIQMLWAIDRKAVHRASQISALGKDMKDGILATEAIERAKNILNDYIDSAMAFTDRVIITGTSCSREASNIREISDWIERHYNLEYRILSEEEEAAMTAEVIRVDFPEYPRIVSFDIGGGSTEFNLLENGRLLESISLPVGIRRLENLFSSDTDAKRSYIDEQLQRIAAWKNHPLTLIGIGGSIANLAAVKAKLVRYNPEIVHKMHLNDCDLKNFIDTFGKLTYEEICRLMPFEPARADLIRTGSIFIKMVMDFFEQEEVVVSDHGLMFGMLYKETDIL